MNEVSESRFAASWINPEELQAARTSIKLSQGFGAKRRPFVSPALLTWVSNTNEPRVTVSSGRNFFTCYKSPQQAPVSSCSYLGLFSRSNHVTSPT
jgi:hypothetical protein